MSKDDLKRAKQQAQAQFDSIREMVKRLQKADKGTDEAEREAARREIEEDPLSVMVRDGWRQPGGASLGPEEYEILLCTGGPAIRLVGQLGDHNEPETAQLEYQDWFTPWTPWQSRAANAQDILLVYAQSFYFE